MNKNNDLMDEYCIFTFALTPCWSLVDAAEPYTIDINHNRFNIINFESNTKQTKHEI